MAKTFKHSLSLKKSSLNQIATVSLNANVSILERETMFIVYESSFTDKS